MLCLQPNKCLKRFGSCAGSVLFFLFIALSGYGQLEVDGYTQNNSNCNGNPCLYQGPDVLINEINLMPDDRNGKSVDGSIAGTNYQFDPSDQPTAGEWIELYNPSPCNSLDLSCYYIGNNTPDRLENSSESNYGASFQIPFGTVLPPHGFLVLRGVNAQPIPLSRLVEYGGKSLSITLREEDVCLDGGTRFWLRNDGGWLGVYNPEGDMIDGVRWRNTNQIEDRPCIDEASQCGNASFLESYEEAENAIRNHVDLGQNGIARVPDGGNWFGANESQFTLGDCNSDCNIPVDNICNGAISFTISGGTPPYSVNWQAPISGSGTSVSGLCAGRYCAVVSDSQFNSQLVCFDVANDTVATFIEAPDTVCFNDEPVAIEVDPPFSPDSSVWDFWGTGMEDGLFNPELAQIGENILTYEYTDEYGCSGKSTKTIFNKYDISCIMDVFVPNVFTPNGDGLNDVFFEIFSKNANFTSFEMTIYDRWGKLIFETTDVQSHWDGTIDGNPVPIGVYVWVIDIEYEVLELEIASRRTGEVALLR